APGSAAGTADYLRPKRGWGFSARSGSKTALPHSLGRSPGGGAAVTGPPLAGGGSGPSGSSPLGRRSDGCHRPRASLLVSAEGTGCVGGPRSGTGGSWSDATFAPWANGDGVDGGSAADALAASGSGSASATGAPAGSDRTGRSTSASVGVDTWRRALGSS